MRHYNTKLGCYIEIDEIDKQASREGQALRTASENRINNQHRINKHNPRFTKSKWAGD